MKSLSMCYTIKDEDSRVIFHDSRKAKSTAHYISEEHVRNPSVLINFCAAKVRLKYSANSGQTQRLGLGFRYTQTNSMKSRV